MKTVSCAVCDEIIELPDSAHVGDTILHCGVRQRLSMEYGTFLAKPENE